MPVSRRKCQKCGKNYIGSNSSKFCSDKCRDAARPDSYYRPEKTCEVCGKKYKGRTASKYCSDECKGRAYSHLQGDEQLCGNCGKLKPLADFAKNASRPSGLDNLCATCRADYVARKIRTPAYRFSRAKAIVKQRKNLWELSREQFYDLIAKPCHYCGCSTDDATGIGLDRIDNSKGYVAGNVLPCCGECNRIRSDRYSVAEMLLIGKVLGDIKQSRGGGSPNQESIS